MTELPVWKAAAGGGGAGPYTQVYSRQVTGAAASWGDQLAANIHAPAGSSRKLVAVLARVVNTTDVNAEVVVRPQIGGVSVGTAMICDQGALASVVTLAGGGLPDQVLNNGSTVAVVVQGAPTGVPNGLSVDFVVQVTP